MSDILIHSFKPIIKKSARILILGSMPGVKSLTEDQYYAHPQNAFWRIMSVLLDMNPHIAYAHRTAHLSEVGIGLWDVLHTCQRDGSLDSNIEVTTEVGNDFVTLFQDHPTIGHVFFNGAKAESAFKRHALPQVRGLNIEYQRLPSTSPAHAGMSFDAKLDAWRAILDILNRG